MKITPIVAKELKQYFYHPTAYIVASIFLFITGWFFSNSLFILRQAELRSFTTITPFLLMFFIPAITMKMVSEEFKQGTFEVVLTNPIKDRDFVMGKYFASMAIISIILCFTLYYPFVLVVAGVPDVGIIISSYVGILFLASTYISIGLFGSSITKNQIVAFIVSFMIIFILFMLDKITIFFPAYLQAWVEYLSITYHFNNFVLGLIELRDIVYHLSVTCFFLFLANLKLVSRYN